MVDHDPEVIDGVTCYSQTRTEGSGLAQPKVIEIEETLHGGVAALESPECCGILDLKNSGLHSRRYILGMRSQW